MQILLVASTPLEIRLPAGSSSGPDLLITGVGVPATIYHLQKRLHQIDYDLVIQAGIAGSFGDQAPKGEVVLVNKDRFADLGTEEKGQFRSVFEYGLADADEAPFESGWLMNRTALLEKLHLPKVTGVTINTISDNEHQRDRLISQYDPAVESMEGAALHYVCLQEEIPFLQLRSLSNKVGERDKSKWCMEAAIENLNLELDRIIRTLQSNSEH